MTKTADLLQQTSSLPSFSPRITTTILSKMKKPSRQKTTTDNDISGNSSKIPFPPRKIRNLSPPTHGDLNSSKIPFRPKKNSKTYLPRPHRDRLSRSSTRNCETLNVRRQNRRRFMTSLGGGSSVRALIVEHPPPALNFSRSSFFSLVKSILYQQLATKAAKWVYTRFLSLVDGEENIRPNVVLSFTPQQLCETGISFRKASYLHDSAEKYEARVLWDDSILEMDNETLLRMLTRVKGIGMWPVHMFMIFSLHRPDVLPVGDLGVRKGVRELYQLRELLATVNMEEVCEKWRPYKSVGAWYMWRLMEAKPKTGSATNHNDQSDISCCRNKCQVLSLRF